LEPGQWYDTKPTKGVEPVNEATFRYQSSLTNTVRYGKIRERLYKWQKPSNKACKYQRKQTLVLDKTAESPVPQWENKTLAK
jgi:hypothetical protein